MDVTELKLENVLALVEKKAVRETKVKFVLCADSAFGVVANGPKACGKNAQRCRKCLCSLASSWAGGSVLWDP